ncbi:MAG: hypothetical protein Q9172_005463 [Xanthocarpia lactea]
MTASNDISSDLDSLRDAPDIHEALRIARETILAHHENEQQRHMTEALDRVAKRYFKKVLLHKSEPSLLALRVKVEMQDRIAKKARNKLVAAERTEKKEERLVNLGRKKNRVKRQLEKEKSSKKIARASRDSTEDWTEVNEDLDFGEFF